MVGIFSSGYSPKKMAVVNTSILNLSEKEDYLGHFLSDKRYRGSSGDQFEQGNTYHNNSPVSGFSSHLNLLEDYSPYRTYDPFYWIPQGLFYDMVDARNETGNPVIDGVSGYYTNQKMFNAFSSNITTLNSYKTSLLNQNGSNQSTQVTSLFSQYGY